MLPNTDTKTGEDRGLSPVIAVVLLVGLTVILVAVIGGIVTDTGGEVESAPTAQLGVDFDTENHFINVTHNGGNDLNPETLVVEYQNESSGDTISNDYNDAVFTQEDGLVQAGDEESFNINSSDFNSNTVDSGNTFRIIWEGESGENREIILEEIVP